MALKPPPRLTKRQFLAKPPVNPVAGRSGQERYNAYLNAYARQRQPQQSRPITYASLLKSLGGSFETPAQIEARANRMANQQYSLSASEIQAEAKSIREEAQRRMTAMANAGRLAAAQNAGLFGQVGGEYNAAAQEIRGLGTNLAGGIAAGTAADVAAQNAGLAAVGAPALAVGGPAGANTIAGPTQAGVEAYRGAELPGQAIGTAGEAAQFGLAGMVASQNLRSTQEAQAAFTESVRAADENRAAALKALRAGRPALAAQFLVQLQDANRQQISLAMAVLGGSGAEQTRKAQLPTKEEKAYASWVMKHNQGLVLTPAEKAAMSRDTAKYNAQMNQVDPVKSEALGYYVTVGGVPIYKPGTRQTIPWKKPATTTGTTVTGTQAVASFFASLADKATDPGYMLTPATIYYTSGGVPAEQPKRGSKDHKARVNAVVNYYLQSYWPSIEQYTPKGNRAKLKAEFAARIRAWFNSAPVPDLNYWQTARLKGG